MSLVVPRGRDELIEFYRTHLPVWRQDPSRIGLSAVQLDQLEALVQEADERTAEMNDLRVRAMSATTARNDATDALRRFGAGLMTTIRGHAQTTNDRSTYTEAMIPPPAAPTPAGKPTTPTAVRAQPGSDGAVTLAWEGTISGGQFFTIMRSIDNGPFVHAASLRRKTWRDAKIPLGTAFVQYRIYGRRGERFSLPAQAFVQFGSIARTAEKAAARESGRAAESRAA